MEHGLVTSKGQVLIPARLRRKYKIKTGTLVYFWEKDDRIEIEPITSETIRKNIGIFGTKGKLLKALMGEKKKEREL
ncbi:MAG: AbrB/MazE/SpoVT family DNA-binding domain-containing protein [Ignavibacteriaceae bacterium]